MLRPSPLFRLPLHRNGTATGEYTVPASSRPGLYGAHVTTTDVLVVGAGIVGAACAFRLAEQGLSTIVLEKAAAPAMGSTGLSAAGVRVQFTTESNILLSWESIQEYRDFEALYGEDAGYEPIGYLFLVPETGWPAHREGAELQQRLGVPVSIMTPGEAQEKIQFRPEGIHAATFGPADGVIDPHRVTLTYLRLAQQQGCEVRLDTPFRSARRVQGGWRVTAPDGEFEARYIVNAAGAWAGDVGRRAGLDVPVQPVRRMVFMTAPQFGHLKYPLTIDLTTGFYLRSEGSRLLLGRSNPAEPPGFREGMDWSWLEPALGAGLDRFPVLEAAGLDRRASWWGYYETTPDHNPILGLMPGVPGWVNACGFSGHGVQQAAAVGRVIAEEIMHGKSQFLNIDPLRIERFAREGGRAERNIV